jgi:hypothetical protein
VSPSPASLGRAGRVRLELIAISFVAVVLAAVCLIALSFEEEKFHVTGHNLDIRLMGVRPDASDDLYDVEGRKIGTRPFDGLDTNAWGSNMLRRDLLFELPEGVVIWPAGLSVANEEQSLSSSFSSTDATTGRVYTVELSFIDFYWHSDFFFGGPRPVEFVDVTLSYYVAERGPPLLRFVGPFALGVTNVATSNARSWWQAELSLTGTSLAAGATNAQYVFRMNPGQSTPGLLTFLDRQGKRHLPVATNTAWVAGKWSSSGYVPGLNSNDLAAAEIHLPLTKTFHHVKVRYPERPVLTAPAPRGK